MRRAWIVASIGIAVLGAAAISIAAGPKLSEPTRIHVIEVPSSDVVIDNGTEGDSPGDLLPFGNELLDTSRKVVGRDQGSCIRINPARGTWECSWTNMLPKGHINVSGPFSDRHSSVLSVTGGTGAYKNARGTMVLKFRDSGNFDFIFHLIP